jgi:integrase/recombinase XerD
VHCYNPKAMAITYKLFLDERTPKGNNRYALKLRITLNRKHKFVPLNVELTKDEWNPVTQKVKASHPNAKLITVKINKTLNELQEKALKYENTEKVYNVDDLICGGKNMPNCTFLEFADREIENLKKVGRVGNAKAYQDATNRLIKFAGKKSLRFENIDFRFLEAFNNTLLADEVKVNAIAVYMREIRALFNKAIKMDVVEQKYYPFSKYKIITVKTISRALTLAEMKKIAKLKLKPYSQMWHSRNYFLLSFCLIGTNFTDLFKLTPDSIQNDRVIFCRSKTKKIYSIYIHPKAMEILNHYYKPENNPDYLLPVLSKTDSPTDVKRKALQAIKTTNKYLLDIAKSKDCKISQDITTYYARYSWANIAKGLGYSKDLIAEALGHEYGNSVTGIYLDNYDNKIIDAANAKVIEAVFGK